MVLGFGFSIEEDFFFSFLLLFFTKTWRFGGQQNAGIGIDLWHSMALFWY